MRQQKIIKIVAIILVIALAVTTVFAGIGSLFG